MTSVTATHFKSDSSRVDNIKRALLLTYITIGWMTIEGAASLLLGWASKSLLLEAFGIDSMIELFSGFVLLWRLRVEASGAASAERAEEVECRAARYVGYSLYILVVYVVLNSGYGLFIAKRITDTHESVWGILIGLVAKIGMSFNSMHIRHDRRHDLHGHTLAAQLPKKLPPPAFQTLNGVRFSFNSLLFTYFVKRGGIGPLGTREILLRGHRET